MTFGQMEGMLKLLDWYDKYIEPIESAEEKEMDVIVASIMIFMHKICKKRLYYDLNDMAKYARAMQDLDDITNTFAITRLGEMRNGKQTNS